MRKYLKFVVPAAQVLAVASVLGWEKVSHAETTLLLYVLPARHILVSLNFPLVIIWWPIIRATEWLSDHPPFLNQENGALYAVGTVAAALLVFATVALFWYLTITEIQMRSEGRSLVRFSGGTVELLKVVIFFLAGLGSLFHIYTETLIPLHHGLARQGLWPAEIFISALLLSAWGAAFIGVSIADGRKLTIP